MQNVRRPPTAAARLAPKGACGWTYIDPTRDVHLQPHRERDGRRARPEAEGDPTLGDERSSSETCLWLDLPIAASRSGSATGAAG